MTVSQGEAADTSYVRVAGRARMVKNGKEERPLDETGQELPLKLLRPAIMDRDRS